MDAIQYKQAETILELKQILSIQSRNFPDTRNLELLSSEGFLTVKHDLDILKAMNRKCPHSIAVYKNEVVGYALSMHPDFSKDIEILKSMFVMIKKHVPGNIKYVVMGQVCVDEPFRKQGVFRGLYKLMRSSFKDAFDWIITEVDLRNQRSLNAHLSVGFQQIIQYRSDGRNWALIYLPTEINNGDA